MPPAQSKTRLEMEIRAGSLSQSVSQSNKKQKQIEHSFTQLQGIECSFLSSKLPKSSPNSHRLKRKRLFLVGCQMSQQHRTGSVLQGARCYWIAQQLHCALQPNLEPWAIEAIDRTNKRTDQQMLEKIRYTGSSARLVPFLSIPFPPKVMMPSATLSSQAKTFAQVA